MHLLSVTSANIAVSHRRCSLALCHHNWNYIFVADIGLSSIILTQLTPKAAEFGRITQNNGNYAVKGPPGNRSSTAV